MKTTSFYFFASFWTRIYKTVREYDKNSMDELDSRVDARGCNQRIAFAEGDELSQINIRDQLSYGNQSTIRDI